MIDVAPLINFLTADDLHVFYAANLRSSLFSGFLTLSGFLFSAHTFIITHMKKEMYDTDQYRDRVSRLQVVLNEKLTYYGTLKNLSRLLIVTVVLSLTSSLLQLTLGVMVKSNWSAIICMAAAVCSIGGLIVAIWIMWTNLMQWFEDAELDAVATVEKKRIRQHKRR